jgi:hypothetical protein
MMKHHSSRLTAVLLVVALLSAPMAALAAEMTAAEYVDLTIERLKLARDSWRDEHRSPTEAEENALFADFDTTAEAYYNASPKLQQQVRDYLEDNALVTDAIEALSQEIEQLIEQSE